MRQTLTPLFVMTVLIVQKRLTRRSPRPRLVATIPIIIRRGARLQGSPSQSLAAQPPAKTVNLQLHAFCILLMRDVTFASRLAHASMRTVHTNLEVPPLLKVEELILALGTNRLLPVLPLSYRGQTLNSLKLKLSINGANCKGVVLVPKPKGQKDSDLKSPTQQICRK